MKMILKTSISLAIVFLPILSYAEPLTINNKTVQYLENTPEILKTYNLAIKGDAQAQLKLAKLYDERGWTNYRSESQAFYWYKQAANQGSAEAQFYVAIHYYTGSVIKKDDLQTIEWLTKSAMNGYVRAPFYLADIYLASSATEANISKAKYWILKAINSDLDESDALIMRLVAESYISLSNLENDIENRNIYKNKALHFYKKSIALGSYYSAFILANQFHKNTFPKNNIASVKDLYMKGFELLVNDAKKNNADAQYELAYINLHGKPSSSLALLSNDDEEKLKTIFRSISINNEKFQQDYIRAFYWFNLSLKNGKVKAKKDLIQMYRNGTGIEKDYSKALKLQYEILEQNKDITEVFNLSQIYADQNNPLMDRQKQFSILLNAVKDNYYTLEDIKNGEGRSFDTQRTLILNIMSMVGLSYYYGIGVKQDYYNAFKWLSKASVNGDNEDVQVLLGNMYKNGYAIDINYTKALEWYKKAAHLGSSDAQNALGDMYYFGQGIEKNYSIAFDFFKKSAKQENAYALYSLGYMYEYGLGVKQDYTIALEYYKKAMNRNHKIAEKALAALIQKINNSKYSLVNNPTLLAQEQSEYDRKISYYKKSSNKKNNLEKSTKTELPKTISNNQPKKITNTTAKKLTGIDRFGN